MMFFVSNQRLEEVFVGGLLRICAFRLLAFVLGVFVMVGCALTPEDGDRWGESQRLVLKQRAEARWEGLINGDVGQVYSYTSPAYRSVVSLQQFRGKYGRALDWRVARVVDIGYDAPTVASVSVEVTYQIGAPGIPGQLIENKKVLTEKWLYMDGGWWYTVQ
jgi:hypothetical protein